MPEAVAADGAAHALACMPISSDTIRLGSLDENHQIEPELSLLCDLVYADGRVSNVLPRFAMAHNDCSIRRPGAKKISEKKNWGPASKGTSAVRIPIDRFGPGGVLDTYRLACFLERDGELHTYGVDSAVSGYRYFYDRLVSWLIDRLNSQRDEGPLEDLSAWISCANYPRQALISVGATRYTRFGEQTFLQPHDRAIVVLYDSAQVPPDALKDVLRAGPTGVQQGIAILDQLVLALIRIAG